MKKSMAGIWLGVALVAGCGPALQGDAVEPGGPDKRIAGGDGGGDGSYDAPAHRFTPRPRSPRQRVLSTSTVDFSAMPALRLRLGQCYGRGYEEGSALIAGGGGAAPVQPGTGGAGQGGVGQGKKHKKAGGAKPDATGKAAPAGAHAAAAGYGGLPPKAAAREKKEAAPRPKSTDERAKEPSASPSTPSFSPPPASIAAADMAAPEAEMAAEAPSYDADDKVSIAAEPVGETQEDFSDYEDWGAEIYLSNDDTMSLSSAQRVIYAIDHFLPLPVEHIRPHELLNYFSFETQRVEPDDDFSVLGDIAPDRETPGLYTLALSVAGRHVDRAGRRNAAITWVVDRSGSMQDEGRMEYLKRGLARSLRELKDGDIVHMVLFDHDVCVPVENFVVGRDDIRELERAIDALQPMGATDIHRGLTTGYEIADRSYQPEHTNRVVLITDALANTGETDERTISMISKYFDKRRIRLSGVGVGREFNDSLLDRLTERGKGAYVFLGSPAEVDAVFGDRFISLIETTALDVHFLLHLPASLRMNVFYGEESSTVKEDVQAIHYFANTSQLFLSDLMARGGRLRAQDDLMLSIEFEDPETGDEILEDHVFNLGDISGDNSYNVSKGRLIMTWVDMLAQMAMRPSPSTFRYSEGSWDDPEGFGACEDGRRELEKQSAGLENDGEVRRVLDLWEKYCSRYERPRNPVKRQVVGPAESWPQAEPSDPR